MRLITTLRPKPPSRSDLLESSTNLEMASLSGVVVACGRSENVDWRDAGQTKCCRELHLYIEGGKLCCTGFLRVQNATIFPKNIHFFATLLDDVATRLGVEVGEYTHFISSVCHDRSATQC